MRFQSSRSACGPAALHNALSALGVNRSEDELIQLTGQKPEGTSTQGLVKAIKHISESVTPGLVGTTVSWRNRDDAFIGLWWYLTERGRPLILCVDSFDHWVACTGYLGYRFAVMDSADNALALYYDAAGLAARWVGPKDKYYAIVV
jgi:ABC-type bacteriocin/lantibiotic exporter with double-glycine peptidase domain